MKRQNVWFPDPVHDDLARMAQDKDIKVPEAIRKAVEEAIEKWKRSGGSRKNAGTP